MDKLVLVGAMGLMLAGCAPRVPDSGVGFDDYGRYELERAQREAALSGTDPLAGQSAGGAPLSGAPGYGTPVAPAPVPGGISSTELAAAGIGPQAPAPATTAPLGAAAPAGAPIGAPLANSGIDFGRTQGVQASPGNADPFLATGARTGLSDEQNFDAVAGRETIESDAERRARQAAAYQVIQPAPLPERDADAGPNIVAYALNAPNAKGQEYYSRFILSGEGRFRRNCASYRSADEAQRDFLARGGPERDPRGIDPDGDGFACAWDPAPFRAAVAAN